MQQRELRRWLGRGLYSGAGVSLLLLLAAVLWVLLAILGDPAGATVARVLTVMFALAWVLNLTALVVGLVLLQLGDDALAEEVE